MQKLGINTWEHAFVRVPNGGRDLAQQPGPRDGMHVWLEGVTKNLLSYTLYMMVRVAKWCTKSQLRERVKSFAWPVGEKAMSRPGYINDKTFTGKAGRKNANTRRGRARRGRNGSRRGRGLARSIARSLTRSATTNAPAPNTPEQVEALDLDRPNKGAHPPFTAHHMLIWTLLSLEVLRPLIPKDARDHEWWDVWVQQVFVLQSLMKPSHTYQQILDLDIAIYNLFSKFEKVPEYQGFWVPKHHFAQHAAMDILRFGPMRLNWCMMYEAKNQPLKRGCKRSNFHNPCRSTAEFWAESTDHQLRKKAKRSPVVSAGPVKKEGELHKFPELEDELNFMLQNLPLKPNTNFKMLRSASKYNVHFFTDTYAILATMPNVPKNTICRIQEIIMASDTIYLIVDVFPPRVISYDNMGVMQVRRQVLTKSKTTQMLLNLATDPLTALWHYTQKNGILTFVAKW
jgi:hypothetical protein